MNKETMKKMVVPFLLSFLFLVNSAWAKGVEGQKAPPWHVSDWINLEDGKQSLEVSELKGKVVYLYSFQSWCPGCHRFGFPTLKKLLRTFSGEKDMEFVAIQTVFEGFSTNDRQAAWDTAERYDLAIPIGHDDGGGKGSGLMRRYRSGGTPWVIIIDRNGVVRFNDFHVDPDGAEKFLRKLLKEKV